VEEEAQYCDLYKGRGGFRTLVVMGGPSGGGDSMSSSVQTQYILTA
jgi:hypothetical protein